jgi:hypothetical protein
MILAIIGTTILLLSITGSIYNPFLILCFLLNTIGILFIFGGLAKPSV